MEVGGGGEDERNSLSGGLLFSPRPAVLPLSTYYVALSMMHVRYVYTF